MDFDSKDMAYCRKRPLYLVGKSLWEYSIAGSMPQSTNLKGQKFSVFLRSYAY